LKKLSYLESANGILEILFSNISGGIKVVSIQKGYDIRQFSLLAFGGAGPLHASQLMNKLDINRVIIPLSPGNFSATGELFAEIQYDYVRTLVIPIEKQSFEEYNKIYSQMMVEAIKDLKKENINEDNIIFKGTSDIRYAGQAWELNIPVPIIVNSNKDLLKIKNNFDNQHKKIYGYIIENENTMLVNLRLSALGLMPKVDFVQDTKRKNTSISNDAYKGDRKVFLDDNILYCPIYDRDKLFSGNIIKGPTIIEEYGSTTVVSKNQKVYIDKLKNIIIEREE